MSAIPNIPRLPERYTWEAELHDGSIITRGGDLTTALRVSLLPAAGTYLPRHDFVGLEFQRRFLRVMMRSQVGGFDKVAYWREVEARQGPARAAARAARDAKGAALKPVETPAAKAPARDECLQCIVTKHCRIYVRHSDGVVLVGPPNYEVYL